MSQYENTNPQYEGAMNVTDNTLKQQKQQQNHEEKVIQQGNVHELDKLNKQLGWIGRFFGSDENASKNITATICILLLLGASIISIIVYFFNQDLPFVKAMWQNILPVITLSLGYLFGKK